MGNRCNANGNSWQRQCWEGDRNATRMGASELEVKRNCTSKWHEEVVRE